MTPITKRVTVPLSPAEAFTLFINDMATWWPVGSFSVTKQDAAKTKLIVEAHKGGKIIEVGPDGKRFTWGEIIGWDTGKYVAFSWHPGRPEEESTIVAVSFERTKDGCAVTLTHGGFEILGDTADAVSQTYLNGWDIVLGTYCAASKRVLVMA